ncbi:hypothetical protein CNO08_05010 [Lysobacter capsici]|nr:hypothetical protein CNO08_05010 [Lysobacter capsici]
MWKVRNDGRYDGYFGEGLGSKNAELAFQRSDGKDYVLANIAVQAIFRAINDSGFQPFASARWKRIDTKDKQSDIRDLSLGMDMPLGDPRKLGLYLTPLYIHRTDIYGDTDSRLFTAHGNIVKASWVKLGGDATRNNFSFIPYFGLIHERRKSEEGKWGEWNSGYIGFEWSAQWNRVTPRLQSTVKYQYFTDFSKPGGAHDRDSDYGVASISYEFTDPEDETITVRPSIFLTREVGLNPVLGADRINETTFGFGLKVN